MGVQIAAQLAKIIVLVGLGYNLAVLRAWLPNTSSMNSYVYVPQGTLVIEQ